MTIPLDYLALLEELGDRAEIDSLLRSFSEQLAPQVDQLEELVRRGELPEAARVAHALRGGALNMRADPFAACAAAVERASSESDMERCTVLVPELRERCREIEKFVAERCGGDPIRVLYAEDEYTNRRLLQLKLRRAGIVCDLAEDGEQAVEMFRANAYNVIILDQYMPKLNGEQVARMIRAADRSIPLIAVTSDIDGERQLSGAGFTDVFVKPLRGSALIERIEERARESKR